MHYNFIRNLLDLKGGIVKKVRYKKSFVKIHIEFIIIGLFEFPKNSHFQ